MYLTNLRKQQQILIALPSETLSIEVLNIDCKYQNAELQIGEKEYLLCLNDCIEFNSLEMSIEGVYKNSVRLGILADPNIKITKH